MTADHNDLASRKSTVRGGPIHGLVLCGVVLIVAIVIGTATMVGNFRERALHSSGRELDNTVLMLARHFDQQLEDFEVVQKDIIADMQSAGIATDDAYRRAMSGREVHLMLKAKISAMSYVGGINLFDSDGRLAAASRQRRRSALLQNLQIGPSVAGCSDRTGAQPHHRGLDDRARPQAGRTGWRIPGSHWQRHRASPPRDILRVRGAR
jgi:hypothetical protein